MTLIVKDNDSSWQLNMQLHSNSVLKIGHAVKVEDSDSDSDSGIRCTVLLDGDSYRRKL